MIIITAMIMDGKVGETAGRPSQEARSVDCVQERAQPWEQHVHQRLPLGRNGHVVVSLRQIRTAAIAEHQGREHQRWDPDSSLL